MSALASSPKLPAGGHDPLQAIDPAALARGLAHAWRAVLEAIQPARPAPNGALDPNASFELSMVRAGVARKLPL